MNHTKAVLVAMATCVLALVVSAQAATIGRQETRDGKTRLILEDDLARIAVRPELGGAIVEYVGERGGAAARTGACATTSSRPRTRFATACRIMGRGVTEALPLIKEPSGRQATRSPVRRAFPQSCVSCQRGGRAL